MKTKHVVIVYLLMIIFAFLLSRCSIEKRMLRNPQKSCDIAQGLCFKNDTSLTASHYKERDKVDSTYEEDTDSTWFDIYFGVDDSCDIVVKRLEKKNKDLQDKITFKDNRLSYYSKRKSKVRIVKEKVIEIDTIPEKVYIPNPANKQREKQIIKLKQKVSTRNKVILVLALGMVIYFALKKILS
jgi:hypothetical protein